ncbi:hypothetical protein ES703_101278 [subsurface metagenome]
MWWLVTVDKSKKNPYGLFGPYGSKFEAQKISDKIDVESEALDLPTSNLQKATQLVKAKISGESGQFRKVTGRFRHG